MKSLERIILSIGLAGTLAACSGTVEVVDGKYNTGSEEDGGNDAGNEKDSGNEVCYTCSCEESCKHLIICDPSTTEPADNAAMCTSHCESGDYKATVVGWFKCINEQCYEGMGKECADYLPKN